MTSCDLVLGDKRLSLKRLKPEDVSDEYVSWLNDRETNRYLEVRHHPQTLASVVDYVSKINNSGDGYLFGIYIENAHVGNIQLMINSKHYQVGTIGLIIGNKDYWGQNIATDAIRIVTNFAFNQLKLKKIEAGCYEANLGSLNCFLKCGYVVEGFLQNCVEASGKRMGVFRIGITAK